MCEPTTLAVIAIASSAASVYGQYQSGKAQVKAINQQNEQQAQEIADAASQEMFERGRLARRERGQMRAAASEAGISLGSGSFLAALQASAFNQYNDSGLILQNEKNQQLARDARARSLMSQIQMPTALSAALQIGAAGVSTYAGAKNAQTAASKTTAGG